MQIFLRHLSGIKRQGFSDQGMSDDRSIFFRKAVVSGRGHAMSGQRLVGAVSVVITDVGAQAAFEEVSGEWNDLAPKVAAGGADEAFDEGIASGRMGRGSADLAADGAETCLHGFGEDGITVHDDGGGSPAEVVIEGGEIAAAGGGPGSIGVIGDAQQADFAGGDTDGEQIRTPFI